MLTQIRQLPRRSMAIEICGSSAKYSAICADPLDDEMWFVLSSYTHIDVEPLAQHVDRAVQQLKVYS